MTLLVPWAQHYRENVGHPYGGSRLGGLFMRRKIFSTRLRSTLLAIFTLTLFAASAHAATEKVLHSFGNGKDGKTPSSNLILDKAGNLYGTTVYGGSGTCKNGNEAGCGTVFELEPKSGGGWTYKVLYSFNASGKDGFYPNGSLTIDTAGNLYGAAGGGAYGFGVVFELSPKTGGGWTEKVLYSFDLGTGAYYPVGGLILDKAGNLYGTAQGGTYGASGNLYGTTFMGGAYGLGTVFKLAPTKGGEWTESVLHSFDRNGSDGFYPYSSLIFDKAGDLFGTTNEGGAGTQGAGTVFELMHGTWKERVLHTFVENKDGTGPYAGVVLDASGNLYGTTSTGGNSGCYDNSGCGTVFELTPKSGGSWTEKLVHVFTNNGKDGADPYAGVIVGATGDLYGTTVYGGTGACKAPGFTGCGTVFEIIP
jgi:uncharacterized repeat protein (TIGR03803 family)